jgi:hypothetical protein
MDGVMFVVGGLIEEQLCAASPFFMDSDCIGEQANTQRCILPSIWPVFVKDLESAESKARFRFLTC